MVTTPAGHQPPPSLSSIHLSERNEWRDAAPSHSTRQNAHETPTRWKFYDPLLLWLFPLTYVLHVLEERFASAPVLLWHVRLTDAQQHDAFLVASALALLLMLVGIRLAPRGERYKWIVPALATAVLLNTVGHVVGSAWAGQYSAGMISAVILWMPLGLLTLVRVFDQASRRILIVGVGGGLSIEAIVITVMKLIASNA